MQPLCGSRKRKWAQKLKKNVSYGKKFWTDVWTKSSMPKGESWSYLEDTAGSIEEATYRLKNMALLDYITECYKNKKESQ